MTDHEQVVNTTTFWQFAGVVVLRMVAQGRTRLLVTLSTIGSLTYAMKMDPSHVHWYAIGVVVGSMMFMISKALERQP